MQLCPSLDGKSPIIVFHEYDLAQHHYGAEDKGHAHGELHERTCLAEGIVSAGTPCEGTVTYNGNRCYTKHEAYQGSSEHNQERATYKVTIVHIDAGEAHEEGMNPLDTHNTYYHGDEEHDSHLDEKHYHQAANGRAINNAQRHLTLTTTQAYQVEHEVIDKGTHDQQNTTRKEYTQVLSTEAKEITCQLVGVSNGDGCYILRSIPNSKLLHICGQCIHISSFMNFGKYRKP